MQAIKILAISALTLGLLACGDKTASTSGSTTAAPNADVKAIAFVDTQESKPLVIDTKLFDTPESKEFLATGKNPYIGNADAQTKGRKVFLMYSCSQCHGPEAKGQVGPGLTGPDFHYPKNASNKGMFETIWHGTNNGMGAKGKGLMDPTDATNGLTPDEVLKVIAWIRSKGTLTGNES